MQINVDLVYPIGSIYMTISTVSPAVLFGGTWERIKGRCIVGVDENDTDFGTVSKTGGEKTHKLIIDEMPSHSHTFRLAYGNSDPFNGLSYAATVTGDFSDTSKIQKTGGNQPHNNLQPYYTAYIWRRTA